MATAATEIKPDFGSSRKHFIFSDEHEALRESLESFVKKELAPHSEEWERDGFPNWVFERMGELGFLGLHFPEEYGGQGGDYFTSIVRSEAMAHSNNGGLAMGIAVHTDMATPPILKFGSDYLKQTYLVPAIRGEKISCLGISEPGAGSDVAGIRTRAVRDGDGYVINGAKTFITNGGSADLVLVAASTNPDVAHGMSLLLVDTRDCPGFSRGRVLDKIGQHSGDTAELFFTDSRMPVENLLGGDEGQASCN
jgi:alkylation response protein AidB-like acyl-CoA dehydrogenase